MKVKKGRAARSTLSAESFAERYIAEGSRRLLADRAVEVCGTAAFGACGGGPSPTGRGEKAGEDVGFDDSMMALYVADSSGCAGVGDGAEVEPDGPNVDWERVVGLNGLNGSGSSTLAGGKERTGAGGSASFGVCIGVGSMSSSTSSSSSVSSPSTSIAFGGADGVAEPPLYPLTSSRVVSFLPEPFSCSSFCAAPRLALIEPRRDIFIAEVERRSDSFVPIFSGRAICS